MKKKLLLTLLALTITCSGCGSKTSNLDISSESQAAETVVETESTTESDLTDLNSLGDVKVEKELFDVVITIPADYVGETTQEELEEKAKDSDIHSITLNDDGSATYVMSKSQHKKLMQEMADNINNSLADMINSDDYPNITDIKANSDFTNFTVTTTSTELGLTDSVSVMAFYMYGGLYAIFNGTEVDNIHVDFVNADSGEIISSSDSSDMTDSE
jgi:hypothetical protein